MSSEIPLLKNIPSIMDLLRGSEKNLKQIAGAIGVIQSLAWIIMALICIILYYTDPKTSSSSYHFMDQVNEIIYQLFLKRYHRNITFHGQSLIPSVFAFFSWVYLIFDLTWFATSCLVLLEKKKNLRLTYQIWSANTALVCAIDLILVIILGANYDKCLNESSTTFEAACAVGILPVLVIAAKGFVLWIVNVTFAVVVLRISNKLKKESPLSHFMPRSTLQGSPYVGQPYPQQLYQYNNGSPVPARFPQSPYSPQVPTTPYTPAAPTTPFPNTVPRTPVRQSWSGYTPQVPTQQPYRQYQQPPFILRAPPRRY